MLYQELKDDSEQFDHFIGPDGNRMASCGNQTDDGRRLTNWSKANGKSSHPSFSRSPPMRSAALNSVMNQDSRNG